jgi:putative transposase
VVGISGQSIYRRPKRPPAGQRRRLSSTDRIVLEVARADPTDGTRMVAALAGRDLGRPVNGKRVRRLRREHALLQRRRSEGRRRQPGFFHVEHPDQLWHLDMTSVWVAEHGWCYLNAAMDCCTREIVGWSLDLRCRAEEASAVVDAAVCERAIEPGALTLGTDNGSAFTSRAFRARLGEHGIVHRRGGYRDPEGQAFIESLFSKLKQRCIWREESKRSTRRARRSAPTSTATTTGRTHGWPIARRARSRPPGTITTTSQSPRPDRQHPRGHATAEGARGSDSCDRALRRWCAVGPTHCWFRLVSSVSQVGVRRPERTICGNEAGATRDACSSSIAVIWRSPRETLGTGRKR